MRVLLAEDDAMIGAAVRDRLSGQGLAVLKGLRAVLCLPADAWP